MATISSGVNPYLAAYQTTQTSPVSGSAPVSSSSPAPSQSSVSVSLSANSLMMASAFAAASAPVNSSTLSVTGNTLSATETVAGFLSPNDIVRIYDGSRDITSKFSGYQSASTPAGIPVSTGGTFSTAGNPLAFNGKLPSNLSITVSKYQSPGLYDPESVKSNVVVTTLDTTPPVTPRATQGTGTGSRTITLTAPEPNVTVEIWNGDPASGGVQVYGGGASDTFMAGGPNQYTAKAGAYDGTETISLRVYYRDQAGNISQPSTIMTRPIDSLDHRAGPNASAYIAARDAGTLASFKPIDIIDKASSITDNIDTLQEMVLGGYVPSIKLIDSRPPVLTLSATQVANNADALALVTSNLTPPVPFTIDAQGSFTADQVLALPASLVAKIKTVNISLSAADAVNNLSALNQLLGSETLKAGQPSKFVVGISDTVQAVQDNFDQIATLKSINSIKLTDQFDNPTGKTIPLVLRAAQLKSTETAQVNFRAITATTTDLTLTIAGQTLTVKAGNTLSANEVADAFAGTPPADATVATLTGTLAGYEATRGSGSAVSFKSTVVGDNVADLAVTGTASRLTASKPALTIAQGGVDLSIINKLPVNYVARITEAKAKDALALQKNAHVVDFTVQDTVDQALLYAKTLNTLPKSFTMTIKDTTANLAARTNNLGTITKPYTLNITDATVDKILQFGKQLKTVKTQFSIRDTVANVLAKSNDLAAIKSNFSLADANNVISNDGISVITNSGMTVSGVKWNDAQFADASDQVKQILINSPIDTIYKSTDPDTFTHVDVLKSISKVLKVNILVDSNTTADQIDMLQGISDVPGVPMVAPSTIDANIVINGVPVTIPAGSDLATIRDTINTAVDTYNQQIVAHNLVLRTPESLVDLHAELNAAGTGIVLYSNATSAIEVKDMSNITAFTGLNFGVSGARVNGVPMSAPSGSIKGTISLDSGLVATTTGTSAATVALKPGPTTLADVTFAPLKSGASVTLAGLTFKANVDLTKEQVAAAFANIADNMPASGLPVTTDGVYSGTMTGWSTGAASAEVVPYTATKAPTILNLTLGRDISKNMAAIVKAINDASIIDPNLGIKATSDGTVAGGISLTSDNQTPISVSYPNDLGKVLGLKFGLTSKVLQFDCSDAYVLPTLKDSLSALRNFYTLNVIDTQANIDANRAALNQAGRNNVMLTVKR